MSAVIQFEELLAYPLRSGVTVPRSLRGSGVKMVNMGELFRYPRLPDVPMTRVDIDVTNKERYLLKPGDLLFARRSLSLDGAGRCCIVNKIDEPTTWESSILRARLNRNYSDPAYYFYFFQSPQGRQAIETIVEQVAAAGIRSSDLRQLNVPHPVLRTQQGISQILGALDDKIELNAEIVVNVEKLAELSFQSMQDGCSLKPLSSTAKFINGKAFTKDASGDGRVVVRIAELNSGIGPSTVYSDATVSHQHVACAGDILFAWSGSLTLHRWFRSDAIINQHIFKVVPDNKFPNWLVFQLVKSKLQEYKNIAADKATTMGHIQRRHLDEPVPIPSDTAIDHLGPFMDLLWRRALLAEQESEQLKNLRDALLPQLMSGKLRVHDAEQQVSDAL